MRQPLNHKNHLSRSSEAQSSLLKLALGGSYLIAGLLLRKKSFFWKSLLSFAGTALLNKIARDIQKKSPPIQINRRKMKIDPVAEASQESFPASDPPAWTLG